MAYLDSINGPSLGKRYAIDLPEMVLGRHPDCDIVLESGAVSRQHAKMVRKGDQFYLEDLKSRNGSFINNRLIAEPTLLSEGDILRVCELEFSFHDESQSSILSELVNDGSSMGVMLVDDPNGTLGSSVLAKMEVRSGNYGTQITASPEVKLAAMIEIMQALGNAVSIDDVLPSVLDSLFRIFIQADRGFIVLKDSIGTLQPRWVKTRRPDQDETVKLSRTVLKRVMEDKEAIISLDAGSDSRFDMSQSVADFRIRSMIVAPLLDSAGDPLGAIQIDTIQHKGRFEESDLEVLVAVANQAGIAIQNAQLHEQLLQQKLVEQDLALATQVQQAFLPRSTPDTKDYDFFQFYKPANQIGGDYFDYIQLENNRLAIVVADVVGHGVAAAMFMAKLSAETRYAFASEDDPARALTLLNQRVTDLNVERFVTMLVIVLDTSTGHAVVVNAGHMPPILTDKQGNVSEPGDQTSGPPLGIINDLEYEAFSFQINPGEILTLYTDGINEAPNQSGEQFTIARVRQVVMKKGEAISSIGKRIIDSVLKHIEGCQQEDDMCLVLFSRLS